jgi:large subunit ribosomal protein L25
MEKVKLQANKRETVKKAVKNLRRNGLVPAIVYGKGKANQNIEVSLHDFEKVIREHGTTSILLLEIEGDGQKNVLIHELDHHPVTGTVTHIDFYEVSMTEKITTVVPLSFVGDSVAVIEQGGSLITNKDEVEIECLPGNLPHNIEVDISVLVDFEASIHIKDIKVPEGVEIKDEEEEMVATVEPPRSEEEMAELDEPVAAPEMPESEQGSDEASTEETEEQKE